MHRAAKRARKLTWIWAKTAGFQSGTSRVLSLIHIFPPFMMHGNVVQGVMSFPEMDAMMYKIEGEDLYLIGTCLLYTSRCV